MASARAASTACHRCQFFVSSLLSQSLAELPDFRGAASQMKLEPSGCCQHQGAVDHAQRIVLQADAQQPAAADRQPAADAGPGSNGRRDEVTVRQPDGAAWTADQVMKSPPDED
jgi:hypothetical protein